MCGTQNFSRAARQQLLPCHRAVAAGSADHDRKPPPSGVSPGSQKRLALSRLRVRHRAGKLSGKFSPSFVRRKSMSYRLCNPISRRKTAKGECLNIQAFAGASMAVLGVALTVLMWSTLATSVNLLHGVPTLFVNGVALTLGGLLGLPWAKYWKLPIRLVLLGSGLLFVYHVVYFFALQLGDPIGVSLVHYLWPVIIVCLSGSLATAGRQRRMMLLSVALGFGGAAAACWSVQQPASAAGASGFAERHLSYEIAAYLLALLSAFAWAAYSVLGKRYRNISSLSVGAFSLPAGLACLAMYYASGHTPALTAQDWTVLVYMGLGPMGIAFYLWDFGMKKANTSVTTAMSYATPVLSTVFLALNMAQRLPVTLWIGVVMVVASVIVARAGKEKLSMSGNVEDAPAGA
jgi:drug/metabolite transporter (DMT)-like permease